MAGGIALGSLALMALGVTGGEGASAEVYVDNVLVDKIDLANDGIYHYEGALGSVEVEVKGGAVRVSESGCPLKLCQRRGWVKRDGEIVVCLPNRLLIAVTGGGEPSTDGVTGR